MTRGHLGVLRVNADALWSRWTWVGHAGGLAVLLVGFLDVGSRFHPPWWLHGAAERFSAAVRLRKGVQGLLLQLRALIGALERGRGLAPLAEVWNTGAVIVARVLVPALALGLP